MAGINLKGPAITRDFDVVAFTIDVVQWPLSVKLAVVPDGRHAANEFSGTKYISWAENLTRYERAHEQGLDEVILLNERREISECTSANVFVVDAANRVWTPPLTSGRLDQRHASGAARRNAGSGHRYRRKDSISRRFEICPRRYSSLRPRASYCPPPPLKDLKFRGPRGVRSPAGGLFGARQAFSESASQTGL